MKRRDKILRWIAVKCLEHVSDVKIEVTRADGSKEYINRGIYAKDN